MVSASEIDIWTEDWRANLTIVARADFTGDALEDILAIANGGATKCTFGNSQLFLLTRENPGGVLNVVDAQQYLCKDYQCRE